MRLMKNVNRTFQNTVVTLSLRKQAVMIYYCLYIPASTALKIHLK